MGGAAADIVQQDREPIFTLRGLSFAYPDGTPALADVSLQIGAGERIALVGCNGSGKTTLARHLCGLVPCRGETVTYKGRPPRNEALKRLRHEVGVLFQDPDDHLFCTTLYDDVAFGPLNQGLPEEMVRDRVERVIAAVELDHLLYKPAHLLSFGQKKRAALAAVLAMAPEVLILDEPTAGLDRRQQRIVLQLLHGYEGTLVLIDHDLAFLRELCERVLVMDGGFLCRDEVFAGLLADPAVLRRHGLDFTFRFPLPEPHEKKAVHHHHHHLTTHHHAGDSGHLAAEPMETPLVELQHYSFSYPDGTVGLHDVNLIVRAGETIALAGENGAGKSTLAACLLGLQQGTGYFLLDGTQVTGSRRNQLWRRIGMVFQNTADQLFCPSCREEVAFGPRQSGLRGKELAERVENALSLVGLAGYEERVPLHLSGGERRRLAIAAALAMRPRLLILDEPSAGLDPRGEEMLLTVLAGLPMAILLITHDPLFISRLCLRTLVMHRGTIIRDYPTSDFFHDQQMR
ncbi:MAG: ABC transporter ATP-binding protein [Thermodesulfobacteriota bacterium]